MKGAYGSDLTYVHDVGFGSFAENAAPGVLKILQRSGVKDGLVLDLGCGGGIWAQRLSRAGYSVMGVDLSPHMIRLARQRAPEARFHCASFLDFPFPPCAAITALGECFNYGFDGRNNRASLRRLFERAYSVLQCGGMLIFDVAGPGRAADVDRRFWTGNDWACLVEYKTDRHRLTLTRRITTFRKFRTDYRRAEEVHLQHLLPASSLAAELRRIGFTTRIVRGYGDFRFPKALMGLIARKA